MASGRGRSLLHLLKNTPRNLDSSTFNFSSIRRFCLPTMPTLFQRIGFIGLGNMGSRMANNLIKSGYNICVHDVNHNVMKIFSDKGVVTRDSPSEIAEISDVVITMLPSSAHVLDVYSGPSGLMHVQELRPWLFIDSSTIDPQTSRKLSKALSECSLKEERVCSDEE